jgi:Tol biopolymer transport system component
VFNTDRDSNHEIYTMSASGGGLTRLTTSGAIDITPVFARDGSKIFFSSTRAGNLEIHSMNPNGTGVTRLTTNQALDTTPEA